MELTKGVSYHIDDLRRPTRPTASRNATPACGAKATIFRETPPRQQVFYCRDQRSLAALRAISTRFAGLSLEARAAPPFRPSGAAAESSPCSSGVGSWSSTCRGATSTISLAAWEKSLGRLGGLLNEAVLRANARVHSIHRGRTGNTWQSRRAPTIRSQSRMGAFPASSPSAIIRLSPDSPTARWLPWCP